MTGSDRTAYEAAIAAIPVPAALLDPVEPQLPVVAANAALTAALGRNPIGLPRSELDAIPNVLVFVRGDADPGWLDWADRLDRITLRALQRLMLDAPHEEVLHEVLATLEDLCFPVRFGMLLQRIEDDELVPLAPHVPLTVLSAMREPVVRSWGKRVRNVDPARGEPLPAAAAAHGIGTYWAEPIRDRLGDPVGALLYFPDQPRLPSPFEQRVLDLTARFAGFTMDLARIRVQRLVRGTEAANRLSTSATLRFLSAASHDLRQPLQALECGLDLLMGPGREAASPLTQSMTASVIRIREILDSLLDLERLETGQLSPTIEDFPVSQLLDEICRDQEILAHGKGVELKVRAPALWVRTDPILLRRLLENLTSNAARYTLAGSVTLTARALGEETVEITVADTGPGLPHPSVRDLFHEPAARAEPLLDYRRNGIGVGLRVVKRLCDLLDLPVSVQSHPRRGTRFRIRLPRGTPAVPGDAAEGAGADSAVRRVLFVDDDLQVLDVISRLLRSRGYDVASFADSASALDALHRIDPDVLLVDYRMPQMSGLELTARVRTELGRVVPSIIMTGDTSVAVRERHRFSQSRIVRKPLRSNELIALIEEVAGRSSTRSP